MPVRINGVTYFRTREACEMAGISRATFFRWLKEGIIEDVKAKDRRGWRLFTQEDVDKLRDEATKVDVTEIEDRRQLKLL